MSHSYPMQMKERELSLQDALEILEAGEYAVVSTVDADGAPYGVPLSYVMMDGKMYIHTGKRPGHKIDDWIRDGRVSVAVASEIEPIFEDTFFTTRFASVVASGIVSKVEDSVLVRQALVALCMKYCPEYKHEIGPAIQREWDITDVWVITLGEIRGKAGRRLKK